ncbi:MAG: DUF3463 domain-containing protein [Verrucomicrobia bacterium]|nr:DUF3463 domain-containing protein [Verrucomicrobiota bacterium]MBV9297823.1 DUF3463 domain-containing protein [Verrucomicrobiota bacterium]MBV9644777.1 DUF3463 domain-containing protein [Verrucomicrobiota bacterium]
MRFPLPLTMKIAGHLLRHKLQRSKRFATVLQLEPLHTCNLTCTGCGRIREYSTSMKDVMSLADCLGAAIECDAPMVSICGGEPLIYPQIEALVNGLLGQRRIVYVCTNGMWMRKKMRDYLAAFFARQPETVSPQLDRLADEKLLTPSDIERIKAGPKDPGKPVIAPSRWMYWNVHLDGLEKTHDIIVEREGVFQECVLAIRMAKILGFQVATNTTVYRETDVAEIEHLFGFLATLGVDGHTISPGYDYDAAKKDMAKRLGLDPANFFLTRRATIEKFARATIWGKRYPLLGTPVYLEFVAGFRDLTCSAWAIPTRNIKGWKAPCYFMTDGHYASFKELQEKVDWSKYGVVDGVARDPRCENCMVQCGYEPSATIGLQGKPGDTWKNIWFNFGPRPRPKNHPAPEIVFNGISAAATKPRQEAVVARG